MTLQGRFVACNATISRSWGPVANRFDVVAVRIEDERTVVIEMIIGNCKADVVNHVASVEKTALR